MPQPTDTASSPPHPDAPHRVVTPPRRPVHYAPPTQQWLDFLAGLLVQTVQAERASADRTRSEEHTSELQSPYDLVCRLLLEKKKKEQKHTTYTVQPFGHT